VRKQKDTSRGLVPGYLAKLGKTRPAAIRASVPNRAADREAQYEETISAQTSIRPHHKKA
jgi:hypothetical protein